MVKKNWEQKISLCDWWLETMMEMKVTPMRINSKVLENVIQCVIALARSVKVKKDIRKTGALNVGPWVSPEKVLAVWMSAAKIEIKEISRAF